MKIRPISAEECGVAVSPDQDAQPDNVIRAIPWVYRDPKTIPPRQWAYGRHYIHKFVSATVAPGGVGKTSLSIVEGLSKVIGRDLLDNNKIVRPGRVWIYNAEDPRDELERRIAAVRMYYHISPDALAGHLFVNSGRETEIVLASKSNGDVQVAIPTVEQVKATIRENKIDVMIVDPFVSTHRVPENDNGDIDRVVKTWARIADETNAAIELVHHTRKASSAGNGEPSADDARGASALVYGARSVRVLSGMTKKEGEEAGVENYRAYFSVMSAKQNLAPPSEERIWRQLISLGLGNGTAEWPEQDLVGVVASWKWPDAFADIEPGTLRRVQAAITKGSWREDSQSKNWVGNAIAEALDLDPTDPRVKAKVKVIQKDWTKSGALKVMRKTDENYRERSFVEVGSLADAA